MRRALVFVALVMACDHSSGGAAPAPSASVAPVASTPPREPASVASAAPSASASASAAIGAASSWKGAYKAKVGVVNAPKDSKIQLWAKDDGAAFVGDGSVHLTITGTSVRGEAKGALGDQLVTGVLDDTELSARLDPKNPNTEGAMTGVLTGKLDGAAMTATLRVSGRNGNVVREATFTLTRE